MKKYHYEYFVYTNNIVYGKMKITEGFKKLKQAQEYLCLNGGLSSFGDCGWHDKYGSCDIVKQRVYTTI